MTREEKLKLLWEAARKERTDEINRFWSRSLFFWGFIAATLVVLGGISAEESLYAAKVGLLGLGSFLSLCMYLANRGSKKWQETWEQRVEAIEKQLIPETPMYGASHQTNGFDEITHRWLSAGDFSVSKISTGISLVLFTGFLGCFLNLLVAPLWNLIEFPSCFFSIASCVGLIILLVLTLFFSGPKRANIKNTPPNLRPFTPHYIRDDASKRAKNSIATQLRK